jgi:uncharacterized protein YodC (DUF2158 family)
MSFSPGDVVQLKSGGPAMTVTGVVGQDERLNILKLAGQFNDGDVTVEYFDDAKKLIKSTFQATSIVKRDTSTKVSV